MTTFITNEPASVVSEALEQIFISLTHMWIVDVETTSASCQLCGLNSSLNLPYAAFHQVGLKGEFAERKICSHLAGWAKESGMSRVVVLKLWCTLELPGGFGTLIAGPTPGASDQQMWNGT